MNEVVTRDQDVHRRFSPSQSERFFNCHGSTALIERLPARDTSPYAEEGRIAHAVLEAGLRNRCGTVTEAIKHSAFKDHEVCKGYSNFHFAVQDALDHVWSVVEELDLMYGDVVLGIEEYVQVPSLVSPGDADGRVDVYIYSLNGRVIHCIDYKHGVGVVKAAEGNTQVTQYCAGLLYGDRPVVDPANIDTVVLTIIQPRAFHAEGDIRSWTITPATVADYLVQMDAAIFANLDERAALNPGLSWCQFCPARSACPALAQTAIGAILNDASKSLKDLTESNLPDIKSLDVGRISYILAMKPLLLTWIKGVEGHADELSRAGINIPGFKRVLTRAQRRYEGDREELAVQLAALIGCDYTELYKEPSLLNITDMEDRVIAAFKSRVGRGKKKQAAEEATKMFAFFTTKESSGNTTLVPLADSRPAVNRAEQTFSQISGLIQPPNEKD